MFVFLNAYAGVCFRLFVLLVLIMAAALGSESQKLETREISRSELFQESKQRIRNGWNGEPSALAEDIMETPGQEKAVEALNFYQEKYKGHPCMGESGTFFRGRDSLKQLFV